MRHKLYDPVLQDMVAEQLERNRLIREQSAAIPPVGSVSPEKLRRFRVYDKDGQIKLKLSDIARNETLGLPDREITVRVFGVDTPRAVLIHNEGCVPCTLSADVAVSSTTNAPVLIVVLVHHFIHSQLFILSYNHWLSSRRTSRVSRHLIELRVSPLRLFPAFPQHTYFQLNRLFHCHMDLSRALPPTAHS